MFFRLGLVLGVLFVLKGVSATEIFVDNSTGIDTNDGTTTVLREGNTGPVRTLGRATQLASFADAIVLKNTGVPYYSSLSLTGQRHSGTRSFPFVIVGNGATISGLRSVPPERWQQINSTLWKLTLTRKGYYRLLREGLSLPELIPGEGKDPLRDLAPGSWMSWRGSLYFHQDVIDPPSRQQFSYAADQTGISLHQVNHVLIKDVTLQHFRFDGLRAQGICDNIILDNVHALENGHAGIVSSGASKLELFGGTIARNGRHQLLILDRSIATVHDIEIDVAR